MLIEEGFFLHKKPYRETGIMLTALLTHSGKVTFFLRGRAKKQERNFISLFDKYRFVFYRKDNYLFLKSYELIVSYDLEKTALLAGIYINEILYKGLYGQHNEEELFVCYESTLESMRLNNFCLKKVVTFFEYNFLKNSGYLFDFFYDCLTQKAILKEEVYVFLPMQGFTLASKYKDQLLMTRFSGSSILQLKVTQIFQDDEIFKIFRYIVRQSIVYYFRNKPLKSLEFYCSYAKN